MQDDIQQVFRPCRPLLVAAALFSLAVNLLYLASPLYLLQIYDRVIPSGSRTTLVMLTFALLLALAALAMLDVVRARVLIRVGMRLDRLMSDRVMSAILSRPVAPPGRSHALRDFDTVRQYATGSGIHALFDLPWTPIYISVIFLLHPWLGLFALGAAIALAVLTAVNEWLVRTPLGRANAAAVDTYHRAEAGRRNAEVVQAMGLVGGFIRHWRRDRDRSVRHQTTASDRSATLQGLVRFLRLSLQSAILGLGAFLAIDGAVNAGAIFAASILLGRALQPLDQINSTWRNLVAARAAYTRIRELLSAHPLPTAGFALPRPTGALSVEGISYSPPGSIRPLVRAVNFDLTPGESLGIIGPSGAGKSTLARLIVGVLQPTHGTIRLDGADVADWPGETLGAHLGYLPQDIELFDDTVAANIGRLGQGSDIEIMAAARMTGVHEMILRLPDGYETKLSDGGANLSGGVRQRLALARAVLRWPPLVVLDEPNSNLDSEGDQALAKCLAELKQKQSTVVIVSHRLASLNLVDKLLVLKDGVVEAFGPRAEVLATCVRQVPLQAMGKVVGARAASGRLP